MLSGKRVSLIRIKAIEKELKITWGDEYQKARKRILNVTPVVPIKKTSPANEVRSYGKAEQKTA